MDSNDIKIGCYGGRNRTKIIDPNNFNGYEPTKNFPVPLEDLNISVKLKTNRKGRTVLTKEGDKGTIQNISNVSVNFIEGSDINGKKVLTTKYTDLTTVFEDEANIFNNETLGISNINIDFNSAFAPMIDIDFIDVRGSSIFQNEMDISKKTNSANQYSAFFDFPYPLFELEIKGYFGQPVTYCLHMTKFSSKFNSQTGNFEIKCNFIGYTYAMLSDMLVGFLRAIPFTEIGKIKFSGYNENRIEKVINLVELKNKIGNINESIQKVASTSEESKLINSFKQSKEILDTLKTTINGLASEIDSFEKSNILYKFILTDNRDFTSEEKIKYDSAYSSIKKLINKYNSFGLQGLNLSFKDFMPLVYRGDLDKSILQPDSTEPIGNLNGDTLINYKKDLLNELENNYKRRITDTFKFRAYDLRTQTRLLEEQVKLIDDYTLSANKGLANELKDRISKDLGFNPTVRNMVEIFTALIEVFMETIYEVSTKAEQSQDRKTQLKKAFNVDINDREKTTDLTSNDITAENYYPWPDYREFDSDKKTYVEKYLGSCNKIDRKQDIPEIVFIENLFDAFIKAAREEEKGESLIQANQINWFPINAFDTRLYQTDGNDPYTRTNLIQPDDVRRMMLIRGLTFLGYTNDELYLTRGENGEIQKMAKLECDAIVRGVKDDKILNVLKSITPESLLSTTGTINGQSRTVVSYDATNRRYFYNYVLQGEDDTLKIIPLSNDFNKQTIGVFGNNGAQTVVLDIRNENDVFLTNYSSAKGPNPSTSFDKNEDGGLYLKIVSPSSFDTTATLVDSNVKTDNTINLKNLKTNNIINAGFNVFGGSYGIQEFDNMDFGNEGPTELPLMYVFYDDITNSSSADDYTFNKFGLANTRAYSADIQRIPKNKVLKTVYDFKQNSNVRVIYGFNYGDFFKSIGGNELHSNLGKNRYLIKDYINGPNTITYPYIQQPLTMEDQSMYSFSLFGSKWYYLQDNAKCTLSDGTQISAENYTKALLFLNTLPFKESLTEGPFGPKEIKHLFDIRGGFIHTPRLWCAYIGGLLWWMSNEDPYVINNKIVSGGRGVTDPVNWRKACDGDNGNATNLFRAPTINEYFPKFLNSEDSLYDGVYNDMSENEILKTLPNQVKNEFKQVFFDFVNGTNSEYTSFDDLKNSLEINDKPSSQFCSLVNNLTKLTSDGGFLGRTEDTYYFDDSQVTVNLKNFGNYNIISTSTNTLHRDSLFLELKDNSKAVNKLLKSLTEEMILVNSGYAIWRGPKTNNFGNSGTELNDIRKPITVSEEIYDEYFKTLTESLKVATSGFTLTTEEDRVSTKEFGTNDKNEIKLMLYRNCKNIYDKWLGGVTDPNNVIFQCGDNNNNNSNRNTTDKQLGKRYGYDRPKLIHSFRFVTRSFRDIGDELFVNPTPISEKISDNPNTSAYDVISSLLNDNKFEFIALPTFINFKDDQVLESMFKPTPNFEEAIESCGPSFVAVYAGQTSKNLDLQNGNSSYNNDSFDMRCANGALDPSIPSDFNEPLADTDLNGNKLESPYEDPVPVFLVKYGQQNQNIFKDITLDQNEFSESEESLKIMDDISMKGSSTNRSLGGQNMYNVYAVRSYTAEVEMLGNPMIQPMMYFQLDNIPMFHGAYLIKRVKHNIKPNYMSTSFTGIRIRAAETPIIDIAEAYMSLIETLDLTAAGTATNVVVIPGESSAASRAPKKSISCKIVKSNNVDFNSILKLVIDYLEGSYCSGGLNCGSSNSGETLWGLDRENHSGPLDDAFWTQIDLIKNKPKKWNSSYPKPADVPTNIYQQYANIIKKDFDRFMRTYVKNTEVKNLILTDGRLLFNMIYAVYNGAGYFKGFAKILESEYNSGKTTANELVTVFVNERVSGGRQAYKAGTGNNLSASAATLIANTGVDIAKLVGESKFC